MFQTTEEYDSAKKNGNKAVLLAYLTGQKARRVYGKKTPTEDETGTNSLEAWDGTYYTGDGGLFDGGGTPIFSREARVLQFGSFSETLTPERGDLIASLNQSELGAFQVTLDNADGKFSTLLGDDHDNSFLTETLYVSQSFQGLELVDAQPIANGVVFELRLSATKLVLSCEPTTLSGNIISLGGSEGTRPIGYISEFTNSFSNPFGVEIDASGNIYVADSSNNRIQKFNSSYVYQSQFGSAGSGNGQFNFPTGIAFDSSGNIFVADSGNDRIQKFNSAGVYQSQFGSTGTGNGQFNLPYNLIIDASDNMYVADYNNDRIQKFNSAGVYQSQFGISGNGDGEFNNPYDLDFDSSGNIYVVDRSNYRVQRFSPGGVYQSQFGASGSGNGEFNLPRGIAIDSNNTIYISDRGNNRVQVFNSAGGYQSQFGTFGTGSGEFNRPTGIVVNQFFDILVADRYNNRVQVFSA